jgi:hypothetical protein
VCRLLCIFYLNESHRLALESNDPSHEQLADCLNAD